MYAESADLDSSTETRKLYIHLSDICNFDAANHYLKHTGLFIFENVDISVLKEGVRHLLFPGLMIVDK